MLTEGRHAFADRTADFALQVPRLAAIVPPPLDCVVEHMPRQRPFLGRWVRVCLPLTALFVVGVFVVALCLDPYKGGKVWLEETHRQMGLPPCTFKYVTGLPCPSCGMTSSFALLIRGDVWNSLQANAAGTALAVLCLLFIPWSIGSAVCGKLLFVRSIDRVLVRIVVGFLILLFLRWGIQLLLLWLALL